MSDRHSVIARLHFIDWRLAVVGEVQRADIAQAFGITLSQASADFAAFDRAHPGAMTYDKSRRRYVPAGKRYHVMYECHARPKVLRALADLHEAGHPMGWAE